MFIFFFLRLRPSAFLSVVHFLRFLHVLEIERITLIQLNITLLDLADLMQSQAVSVCLRLTAQCGAQWRS